MQCFVQGTYAADGERDDTGRLVDGESVVVDAVGFERAERAAVDPAVDAAMLLVIFVPGETVVDGQPAGVPVVPKELVV